MRSMVMRSAIHKYIFMVWGGWILDAFGHTTYLASYNTTVGIVHHITYLVGIIT